MMGVVPGLIHWEIPTSHHQMGIRPAAGLTAWEILTVINTTSKRPPSEKVAFENAPCKGGYCQLSIITLAIPSAVHAFVPLSPDAVHIF